MSTFLNSHGARDCRYIFYRTQFQMNLKFLLLLLIKAGIYLLHSHIEHLKAPNPSSLRKKTSNDLEIRHHVGLKQFKPLQKEM